MLFNSLEFLFFLPLFFSVYWLLGKTKVVVQNLFLLVSSYLFYSWWDYRFLLLIVFSTFLDYFLGIQIGRTKEKSVKKILLITSLIGNLGLLGFFKYYNFFVDSFIIFFHQLGYELDSWTLQIILPVGISFYTFQTLSYTIDIYKGKSESTRDLIGFATFIAFFPQLVAGPIERAKNLLPQILNKRTFAYPQAISGLRLILWGMFKKVAIADAIAQSVSDIFLNYEAYPTQILLLGILLFGIQIYCDFSGYSDIAIGIAKLLGIELMTNFYFPYFSRNIGEFWRRWHISLSTWFRDYLYIPLGGSKASKLLSIRNVFIVFLVSGFWHGANWTFIIWGLIHALLFIPSFIRRTNRKEFSSLIGYRLTTKNLKDFGRIILTFTIVNLAWVFFRAENAAHALGYLQSIFRNGFEEYSFLNPYDHQPLYFEFMVVSILFLVEFLLITEKWKFIGTWPRRFSYACAIFILLTSIRLSSAQEFIYFQF